MQEPGARWVTISYGELLDETAIVRTGQSLKSAVTDPKLRGVVQPYVDPYSYLLDYALELMSGPHQLPYHNVVDNFPVGSKQPAWVAIFRGGRICITTDNKKSARVFLLGTNPKTAYEENYSVIRHCLRGLQPDDGSELSVEVYAYKNNYQTSELELNLNPYRFSSSNFAQPSGKMGLDLIGLKNFFFEGGQLEGALLDRNDGLVLYAKRGGIETISRHPVDYSDFAIAYRAVFHPGDNPAFVSLDPNPDPTKAMVSFGGFLEDTRIGSVILEADKRFKTISTGLDPNTFEDIRTKTRESVPSFFTSSERDLMPQPAEATKEWKATRFWFYPDSIELETDKNFEYVKIIKPQFMADAERSQADFASKEEFERKKRATLSLSIQKCIEHLNENYSQYTNIYPEIKELATVARLTGICSWLSKANPTWLDLDSLLSVELPECLTEREKTRLLAVTYVSYDPAKGLGDDYVRKNSAVVFLTPILDKKIHEYFADWIDVAEYMCYKLNLDIRAYREFEIEANKIFLESSEQKVRDLIKTQDDLTALVDHAARKMKVSSPGMIDALKADIESDKAELERIKAKINEVKEKINAAKGEELSSLSTEYNNLVNQHNSLVSSLKRDIEIVNQLQVRTPIAQRITGGVELSAKYFNIKQIETSYDLQKLKDISKETEIEWSEVTDAGQWIRSRANQSFAFKNIIPKYEWATGPASDYGGKHFEQASALGKQNYWVSQETRTGDWRDLFQLAESSFRERNYDGSNKALLISKFKADKLEEAIIGKLVAKDRIVFSLYKGEDITPSPTPPKWWLR